MDKYTDKCYLTKLNCLDYYLSTKSSFFHCLAAIAIILKSIGNFRCQHYIKSTDITNKQNTASFEYWQNITSYRYDIFFYFKTSFILYIHMYSTCIYITTVSVRYMQRINLIICSLLSVTCAFKNRKSLNKNPMIITFHTILMLHETILQIWGCLVMRFVNMAFFSVFVHC